MLSEPSCAACLLTLSQGGGSHSPGQSLALFPFGPFLCSPESQGPSLYIFFSCFLFSSSFWFLLSRSLPGSLIDSAGVSLHFSVPLFSL